MYIYLWNYKINGDIEVDNKFKHCTIADEVFTLSEADKEYCEYLDTHDTPY